MLRDGVLAPITTSVGQAVVLAGGLRTRLGSLTRDTPKLLLDKWAGRPFLLRLIGQVRCDSAGTAYDRGERSRHNRRRDDLHLRPWEDSTDAIRPVLALQDFARVSAPARKLGRIVTDVLINAGSHREEATFTSRPIGSVAATAFKRADFRFDTAKSPACAHTCA